ncbi:hypothetical protein BGZ82_004233 [Podila clonocystis]|nr:hypothetical protein BGZ82_004233 [Podila clonocystis]
MLATEAAGMGCDISDVVRVVQYGYPSDLNSLVQRLGRAARDHKLQGYGTLLATKHEGDLDQDLFGYVNSVGCRRQYLNMIYGNRHHHTKNCCDICNPEEVEIMPPKTTERKRREKCDDTEEKQVKARLITWRSQSYSLHYDYKDNLHDTVQSVMPDVVLERFIKNYRQITTLDSIKIVKWNPLNELFASEVLEIITKLNEEFSDVAVRRKKAPDQEKQDGTQSGKITFIVTPPQDSTISGRPQVQAEAATDHELPPLQEDVITEWTQVQYIPPSIPATSSGQKQVPNSGRKSGPQPKKAYTKKAPSRELKIIQFFPKVPPK